MRRSLEVESGRSSAPSGSRTRCRGRIDIEIRPLWEPEDVRFSLGGRPFTLIATDGGLIGSPISRTDVLLAPADRVELAVGPFIEGETIPIESLGYRRGKFGRAKTEPFGRLRVGPAAPSAAAVPKVLRRIESLATGPVTPTREVQLGWKLSLKHGVAFTINQESHHRAESCRIGELQV